jgi:transcriptional repressor NrdR
MENEPEMKCPYCGTADSRVVDTRPVEAGIRRRRECVACDRRFTTYEQVARSMPMVVKSDGRREEYDHQKLLIGVRKACIKRPIPSEAVENVVSQVEDELINSGRAEIRSHDIGNMTLERLRDLDEVAYIRFASVYLPLGDLESIKKEVDKLLENR